MPHTNRKKKNVEAQKKLVVHTKRKEVLDEEGWTHVIDKPQPKTFSTPSSKETPELWAIAADFKIGNSYYVDRTLEEYEVEYERARKTWGKSEACRALKVLLEGKTEEERRVGNVVCLGLGSLQNARGEGRKASFLQLVALMDFLEGLGNEDVKVTFQDPAFTELDITFLKNMDFEVVTDPEAFELIKEDTMVYAIHCYADIYEKVARQGGGKVIVCTDVEKFGGPSSGISDSTIKILEVMVDGYENIEFPQIRSDFSDTRIYWRRSGDSIPNIEDATIVKELQSSEAAEEKKEEVVEPESTSKVIPPAEESVAETTEAEHAAEAKVEELTETQPERRSENLPTPKKKLEEPSPTKPTSAPAPIPTPIPAPTQPTSSPLAQSSEPLSSSTHTEGWTILDTTEQTQQEPEPHLEPESEPKSETTPDQARPGPSNLTSTIKNPTEPSYFSNWLTWWGLWQVFA